MELKDAHSVPLLGQEELDLHMIETHALPCSQCKEVFESRDMLSAHVLTHEDEVKCVCQYCDKEFMDDDSLAMHKCNQQSGPTKCDHCDFESVDVKSFVSHLLQAHQKGAHRIFTCSFCDFESYER